MGDSFIGEPFEEGDSGKKPSYEDLFGATKLLEQLESDAVIYSHIEKIVRAVSETKSYSIVQRQTLVSQLKAVINSKLPSNNFIKHQGFKLISLAQLLRLEKDREIQEDSLAVLVEQIDSTIVNQSDKAFIYMILSELIPNTKIKTLDQVSAIKKALELVEELGCDMEFILRVSEFSRALEKINHTLWKEQLKVAFQKTINNYYRNSVLRAQKRILDIAFKHDQEFAKSLLTLIDEDESRVEFRKQYLTEHYENLEIKKKIIEDRLPEKKVKGEQVATACGKALAALNSGLIPTKKSGQLRDVLDYGIKLPISESESIYSYYIQNLLKRQEDSKDIHSNVDSIFTTIYSICKIIEILSLKHKASSLELSKVDYSTAPGIIVKQGEREKAISYIKAWLSENASNYVKIVDPYFTKKDLEFVKFVLEISKEIEVQILTSSEIKGNTQNDISSQFSHQWNQICEQKPPFTRVTICSLSKSEKSPFHDRGIFTEKVGLRIGTSLGSLGLSKDSEISEMELKEKLRTEVEVFDPYFECRKREKEAEKINFICFTLN